MIGHLFLVNQKQITDAAIKKKLQVSEAQFKQIAKEVKADDFILLAVRTKQDVVLWLTAKASTGVVKSVQRGYINLKFVKTKTTQNCYKLSEGIAVGSSLQEFGWKPLDSKELAASFLDTKIYIKQCEALKKALQRAIPAGLGIDSQTMLSSVLFNGASDCGPVLREWYDAEILLDEPKYHAALKRRLSELDGHTFEELMLVFFLIKAFGYDEVRITKQAGDGGIDLLLSRHDELAGRIPVVVQCKRQSASVGGPEVRGLKTDMTTAKAGRGIFVTTSQFTRPALDFAADDRHIHLIDGDKLIELFFRYAEQAPGLWGTLRRVVQPPLPNTGGQSSHSRKSSSIKNVQIRR